MTLKNNFNLKENLNFGISLFGNQRKNKGYLTGSGKLTNPAHYIRLSNPYLKLKDENGNYIYNEDEDGLFNLVYLPFNILEERTNTSNKLKGQHLNAIFNLDWKIVKNINFRSQYGIQIDKTSTTKEATQESFFARKTRHQSRYYENGEFKYYLPEGGVLQNWETDNFSYNLKNILEYSNTFNDLHEVEGMIGNEIRETKYTQIFSAAYGWNAENMTSKSVIFRDEADATNFPLFNKAYRKNRYASFFGTASYTYNRKYTFFGSIRFDGSDLFGVDKKYRYLPLYSFSVAWNASEEILFKNIEWLSQLKFRASYGLQGNIDKNSSPYIIGSPRTTSVLPGEEERSIDISALPNDKLRWEKTATYNLGVELALFRDALRMSFDCYERKGTDLIASQSLPYETGFGNMLVNWAEMTNKGWEFSVATRNVKSENFDWNMNFNISHNKNRVLQEQVSPNQFLPSRKGYAANTVWVIKTAGLDENGYPQFVKDGKVVSGTEYFDLYDQYADFWPGNYAGSNLKTKDVRELFIDAGSSEPDYSGGILNKFRYKNFDASVSANFNFGMSILAQPTYSMTAYDRGRNTSKKLLDVIQGKNNFLPNLMGATSAESQYWMEKQWYDNIDNARTYNHLDIWLKEINYLRISSIRFGYTLPQELLEKIKLTKLRFHVEARNPFVISNGYDGYFDPESYGNIYAQPQQKSITLGVNLSF